MCDDVTCEGKDKNEEVRTCRVKPCEGISRLSFLIFTNVYDAA